MFRRTDDTCTVQRLAPKPYIDPFDVDTVALHIGFQDKPAPSDPEYAARVAAASRGDVMCQEAIVGMGLIRPYSDYRPHISNELEKSFNRRQIWGNEEPLLITLYEQDGQLIMSDDYELYWFHREGQSMTVHALILGAFTSEWHCRPLGPAYPLQRLTGFRPALKERILENMKAIIFEQGGKLSDIDRRLNQPIGICNELIDGYEELTLEMFEKIAAALNVEPSQLLA